MAPVTRANTLPASVAKGRYEVCERIGAGCYGEVHRAIDSRTHLEVAIKFEFGKSSTSLDTCYSLDQEADVLSRLWERGRRPQGFPKKFYFGQEGNVRCMVMEKLSVSLQDKMDTCEGRTFSVTTTALVAQQVLGCMEYLHSRGIIHRDVKPENFMWGVGSRQHHLYMIDFGLCTAYYGDNGHLPQRRKNGFIGTVRYASINAHRCVDHSRRDDLEALGHMLAYLLRGSLPWSGIPARNMEDKYFKIHQTKVALSPEGLFAGFPPAFPCYLRYCRNLHYKDRPDYAWLQGLLAELRTKLAAEQGRKIEDHDFQWNEGKNLGALTPMQKLGGFQQPDADDCNKATTRSFLQVLCGRSEMKRCVEPNGFFEKRLVLCGRKDTLRVVEPKRVVGAERLRAEAF